MAIYKSVSDLIGNTPLVELSKLEKELGLKARILAKLESFNPAGSVKDRIAKSIILDAEKSGRCHDLRTDLRQHRYWYCHGWPRSWLQGCHRHAGYDVG